MADSYLTKKEYRSIWHYSSFQNDQPHYKAVGSPRLSNVRGIWLYVVVSVYDRAHDTNVNRA